MSEINFQITFIIFLSLNIFVPTSTTRSKKFGLQRVFHKVKSFSPPIGGQTRITFYYIQPVDLSVLYVSISFPNNTLVVLPDV